MDTHVNTASAGHTLAAVHVYPGLAVLLLGDTGPYGAADLYALITSNTVIIGINNTSVHLSITLRYFILRRFPIMKLFYHK